MTWLPMHEKKFPTDSEQISRIFSNANLGIWHFITPQYYEEGNIEGFDMTKICVIFFMLSFLLYMYKIYISNGEHKIRTHTELKK